MVNLKRIDDIIHRESENLFIHLKDSEEYFKIRILNLTNNEIKRSFKNRKHPLIFSLKDENIKNANELCLCLTHNSFKIIITISLRIDYLNKKINYFYNIKYKNKEYLNIDYDKIIEILTEILEKEEN